MEEVPTLDIEYVSSNFDTKAVRQHFKNLVAMYIARMVAPTVIRATPQANSILNKKLGEALDLARAIDSQQQPPTQETPTPISARW